MPAVPNLKGRIFPLNDWEGDDPPVVNYKSCNASAGGRAVAWATNGRIDIDGATYYKAASHDPETGGQTLQQVGQAISIVAKRKLIIPQGWHRADMGTHLKYGRGLMIGGLYSVIERAYRFQRYADFYHEIWISHLSTTSGMRVWDALNPDIHARGRWVPASMIYDFAASLNYQVAYVPLEPLV
jgi:hypothetical protein